MPNSWPRLLPPRLPTSRGRPPGQWREQTLQPPCTRSSPPLSMDSACVDGCWNGWGAPAGGGRVRDAKGGARISSLSAAGGLQAAANDGVLWVWPGPPRSERACSSPVFPSHLQDHSLGQASMAPGRRVPPRSSKRSAHHLLAIVGRRPSPRPCIILHIRPAHSLKRSPLPARCNAYTPAQAKI